MVFSKPSRSYASVDHDVDGLSSVTTKGPYGAGTSRRDSGFKTYRPPLSETHGPRHIHSHDPHPNSSFAPLPPAFQLQLHRNRKEMAEAGQKAELDRILDPEYKSTIDQPIGESSSMAMSRSSNRTGGSVSGRVANGLGIRSSSSMSSFKHAVNGKKAVYMDGRGRLHDTEYDPFRGVSEMSRKQSRRRSAFGSDRLHGSGSSTGSSEGSEVDVYSERPGSGAGRKSVDSGREEEEIRRRLEIERKRLDDLSGHVMARRRSMMSERSGRGTPSLRSSEDVAFDRLSTRTRSQQGGLYYTASPLSPAFEQHTGRMEEDLPIPDTPALSHSTSRARTNTTSDGGDEHPRKVTESTLAPPMSPSPIQPTSPGIPAFGRVRSPIPREPTKERVEIRKDGSRKITGFDAPSSPMPPAFTSPNSSTQLDVPASARSLVSRGSRGSSDRDRGDGESIISQARRPKPAERPRKELFPETPAQAKKREERERRSGRTTIVRPTQARSNLAVDTSLAPSTRLLPEIQIVEDDDPRIIFNPSGPTTRVQKVHDHVIRGPFSLALQAQGQQLARIPSGGSRPNSPGPGSSGYMNGDAAGGSRRPSSVKSTPFSTSGSARGSGVIEEGQGGYLPSRWAQGDRRLRTTEEEKEAYRPKEWGGKHGDLGGRQEEWKPDMKEQFKRQWKDMQTNARFSLFRAKKKLERKV